MDSKFIVDISYINSKIYSNVPDNSQLFIYVLIFWT